MESVSLPDAPQINYLSDDVDHVISEHPNFQMKDDSHFDSLSISQLIYPAYIGHPKGSNTLSSNQGELVPFTRHGFLCEQPYTYVTID